jgi:hypothetical protein
VELGIEGEGEGGIPSEVGAENFRFVNLSAAFKSKLKAEGQLKSNPNQFSQNSFPLRSVKAVYEDEELLKSHKCWLITSLPSF